MEKSVTMNLNLSRARVLVFDERPGVFIAYCPLFDLSASGATLEEALEAFREAALLHIEYCNGDHQINQSARSLL